MSILSATQGHLLRLRTDFLLSLLGWTSPSAHPRGSLVSVTASVSQEVSHNVTVVWPWQPLSVC